MIAEDRCPQLAFLRDSFMITWLTGDYSRRNSPWSDERRTIAWARRKFTEISTWAGQAGCTGKDLYEESAAVFREAMKHSDE